MVDFCTKQHTYVNPDTKRYLLLDDAQSLIMHLHIEIKNSPSHTSEFEFEGSTNQSIEKIAGCLL
jgi:hypothetical protein